MISLKKLVESKIGEIQNLATLPTIAAEVMSMAESERSSMKEISKLIEKDMTIASKILKIANSPLYGYQRKIDTIQKALVLLGLKEVYNIVVGISVYSTFVNVKQNNSFDREQFWNHSAGVARLARILSERFSIKGAGTEFLAGLVHDVGKLVLDQYFPKEFSQVLQLMDEKDISFYDAEQELFDINHAEIGALLLEGWNVPEIVVQTVRYHHAPELAKEYIEQSSIINIANDLEKIWGESFVRKPHSYTIESAKAWALLQETHPHLASFDIEKFTFELSKELSKAQEIIAVNKNG
jgi:putative nucleotidyltransferase with HDIG domain